MRSEVHQLKKQIEHEYASAHNGLHGVAVTARHSFISARYRRIDQLHTRLAANVGEFTATLIVSDISDTIVRKEKI